MTPRDELIRRSIIWARVRLSLAFARSKLTKRTVHVYLRPGEYRFPGRRYDGFRTRARVSLRVADAVITRPGGWRVANAGTVRGRYFEVLAIADYDRVEMGPNELVINGHSLTDEELVVGYWPQTTIFRNCEFERV